MHQPLLADKHDDYWPAGKLKEGGAETGKWQELTPIASSTCTVFPNQDTRVQTEQSDLAWALW
ncbi:TraU protein [compost metagenome]